MKQVINSIMLTTLMCMVATKVFAAYDIAVENEDGVTIYYNYINDGTELEVTRDGYYVSTYSGVVVIPSEVTYMNRTRKVTSIAAGAFYLASDLTSVTIPNSVTTIGGSAFNGCRGLTSITIGNSVTSIGDYAFEGCGGLESITIPSSLTTIGKDAFVNCGVSSVYISDVKSWCNISFANRFSNPYNFRLYMNETEITSLVIPNGVTSISNYAFSGCLDLTSVTIPNSVTTIGEGTFQDCSSLSSVTIPNNVTYIGGNAFEKCSNLTSVTIGNSVTSIGDYAFSSCSGLTSITIPNSVTSIGYEAFRDCRGLSSITIGSSVTTIGRFAFYGADIPTVISLIENPSVIRSDAFSNNTFKNATLYVPKGTIEKYKATEGWKDFLFIVEGDGGSTPAETKKCATPTIGYNKGKLTYNCDTEGAVCQTTITDTDITSFSGNEIDLTVTYNISVYATKAGYENSDVATATLCWIDVDPKTDGITNVTHVEARAVMIKTDGGQLSIEGADDSTDITAYTLDGVQLGSAVSRYGVATINTNVSAGTVTIVKIGNKSVKVVMK